MHNSNYCSDSWLPDKCGGDSNRQCCGKDKYPNTDLGKKLEVINFFFIKRLKYIEECPLVPYTNTNVNSQHGGRPFKVERSFLPLMDQINGFARKGINKFIE